MVKETRLLKIIELDREGQISQVNVKQKPRKK